MPAITEVLVMDPRYKYNWTITLSNGVSGKNITVNGFCTNYIITKEGIVYNIETEQILKSTIYNAGYYRVNIQLGKRGIYKTLLLHRLIGEGFIPNPNNFPVINHIDGNKLNNNIDNLEWCTYLHNNLHAKSMGLYRKPSPIDSEKCNLTKHSKSQVIQVCELLSQGLPPKIIHRNFKIDYDFILGLYNKRTWKKISTKYDFSKVLRYNRFFSFDELDEMDNLFEIGCPIKEVILFMNWEYSDLLYSRVKMTRRKWKKNK